MSQANGSQSLPWIVAPDGSGSHRTIGAAIVASDPNQYIQIKPGAYVESLVLTKPINLLGFGKPDQCIITNTEASPIEVACGLGGVSVEGVSITGNGVQSGKSFNAIHISNGKLRLKNCLVKSSTYNGIKVLEGCSLEATACKFIESNDFSISTRNHVGLSVMDCEFFSAGVQAVGGPATITSCRFLGREGVYVGQSGETKGVIDNCDFLKCLKSGVLATENGVIEVKKSRFTSCNFGVQVYGSQGDVRDCVFNGCEASSLTLAGGKLAISEGTLIQKSRTHGCQVVGGVLEISDSEFNDTAETAIVASNKADILLRNTNISNCGRKAVHIQEGQLTVINGTIGGCLDSAIALDELSGHVTVTGTKFIDNPGGAMVLRGGEVDCEDITVSGSEIALLANVQSAAPMRFTMTRVTFSNIGDVVADLEGQIILTSRQCVFGEVPVEKRFRTLGGAQVKLYP